MLLDYELPVHQHEMTGERAEVPVVSARLQAGNVERDRRFFTAADDLGGRETRMERSISIPPSRACPVWVACRE